MRGTHPRMSSPSPASGEGRGGGLYSFLIDVDGVDDAATDLLRAAGEATPSNKSRDSSALTIVEIDQSTLDDPLIMAPRYLVRNPKLWSGVSHTSLYAQLKALIELWSPRYIVIDSTGVGAGLSSFLEASYGDRVIPFLFSAKSKSDLGWKFLSVIETGRFKDHAFPGMENAARHSPKLTGLDSQPETGPFKDYEDISNDSLQKLFKVQLDHTLMDISTGLNRLMKWGVPDGTRDQAFGELVHDDLVISAALCALLDDCEWGKADSTVIKSLIPLSDLNAIF